MSSNMTDHGVNGSDAAAYLDGKVYLYDLSATLDDLTITGTGFGAHSLDIEFIGGVDGHLRTKSLGNDGSFGSWSLSGNVPKVIVNDATRGHSWKCDAVGATNPLNASMRFDYGSSIAANTEILVNYWAYFTTDATVGQWKMLRLNPGGGIVDTGTQILFGNWDDVGNGSLVVVYPEEPVQTNETVAFNSKYPDADGVWTNVEFIINTGTQAIADGDIKQSRQKEGGSKLFSDYSGYFTADNLLVYGEGDRFRYFNIQNYLGNGYELGEDPLEIGISDPYIQVGSTKRVYLTDNATFSSSTWAEIQKPTSWADTVITVKLNPANRGAGTYYFHVISGKDTELTISTGQTVVVT